MRQQLDELLGAFQETVRSVHRGASNACEFSEGLFRYSSVDLTSDAEAAQFVDNTLKMVADRAEEVGTAVRAVAEDSSVSKNSVDSVASTTVQLSNASKEIAENTEKASRPRSLYSSVKRQQFGLIGKFPNGVSDHADTCGGIGQLLELPGRGVHIDDGLFTDCTRLFRAFCYLYRKTVSTVWRRRRSSCRMRQRK